MNFGNRLKYYMLGIGLGVIISYMFFGNRSCGAWLPGNRIKAAILDFEWFSNDKIDCQLTNLQFSADSLVSFVENSSVNLNKSNTESDPRIYSLTQNNNELFFAVSFTDSSAYVSSFGKGLQSQISVCDTIKQNPSQRSTGKTLRKFTKS